MIPRRGGGQQRYCTRQSLGDLTPQSPTLNTEYQAGSQWVPFLQFLEGPSRGSNPGTSESQGGHSTTTRPKLQQAESCLSRKGNFHFAIEQSSIVKILILNAQLNAPGYNKNPEMKGSLILWVCFNAANIAIKHSVVEISIRDVTEGSPDSPGVTANLKNLKHPLCFKRRHVLEQSNAAC